VTALERVLSDGRLRRVSQLVIPPDGIQTLFVTFRGDPVARESVRGRTRKIEEKVFIRLMEYDADVARGHMDGGAFTPPLRELPVRVLFCVLLSFHSVSVFVHR
jgi:hypothetical protein